MRVVKSGVMVSANAICIKRGITLIDGWRMVRDKINEDMEKELMNNVSQVD